MMTHNYCLFACDHITEGVVMAGDESGACDSYIKVNQSHRSSGYDVIGELGGIDDTKLDPGQ